MYGGDWRAVKRNLKFLTDDEYLRKRKVPPHLRELVDREWLKGDQRAIERYIGYFMDRHSKFFDEVSKRYVPLHVNMDSSPGASWKALGYKTKRDWYCEPRSPLWIQLWLKYAHLFNWVEPYTASPKQELTLASDIESGKCRVFYIAGVMSDFVGKLLCRHFNHAYKLTNMTRIGFVPQHGGVQKMIDEMERFRERTGGVYDEADCSKFDLTRILAFFKMCIALRIVMAPVSRRDWLRPRLIHLYTLALRKYLVWLDGQLILTDRGNPSGWANTSEDNNMDHHFLRWYHCVWLGGLTDEEFDKQVYMNMVSDDALCIMPPFLSKQEDLATSYAHWGRILKDWPGGRVPSSDLNGRMFCGIEFIRGKDGKWEHTTAYEKSFASANFLGGLTEAQKKEKLQGLAALLGGHKGRLAEFGRYLKKGGRSIDPERARWLSEGIDLSEITGVPGDSFRSFF